MIAPDIWDTTVVAVPPLARRDDESLDPDANRAIVHHLESGGVRAILYGGNANFYHLAPSKYRATLEMIAELAGEETAVIPSVGPAFGVMTDQADALRELKFSAVMVLPLQGVTNSAGVATGIRRFSEAAGKPVVLYLKHEGYLEASDVGRLIDDGAAVLIKYAVVRDDPGDDEYLRRVVDVVDPGRIISGIGEQPAGVHLRQFGLAGFTTGCGCIAPRLSMRMLAALKSGDDDTAETIRRRFEPLENLRNQLGPIRVLHEAVALAGIAQTGPLSPLLSRVPAEYHKAIKKAARDLLEWNESAAS